MCIHNFYDLLSSSSRHFFSLGTRLTFCSISIKMHNVLRYEDNKFVMMVIFSICSIIFNLVNEYFVNYICIASYSSFIFYPLSGEAGRAVFSKTEIFTLTVKALSCCSCLYIWIVNTNTRNQSLLSHQKICMYQ